MNTQITYSQYSDYPSTHLIVFAEHRHGGSCGVNSVEFSSVISMLVVCAAESFDQMHHHPHQDGDEAGHGKQGGNTKRPP